MKNVQLLVVDRTSLEQGKPRLAALGDSGEIFVRAGGKFKVHCRIWVDFAKVASPRSR